jgi:recombination protein RecT
VSDESNIAPWTRAIGKAEPRFNEIAEADGNLVLFKREAMFAHQVISSSSYLQKCSPESIFNAIVNVASVGITLSPAEKLAYLVPRYHKESRQTLCCLDISYRGLKHIAESTGAIQTAVAELVRENDTWKWHDKLTKPTHDYDPMAPASHRGDVRGAYCIAVLPSGVLQVEPMSLEELEKVESVSQAKNGPWKDWWEEMAKKSVVRRASKMWPHNRRIAEATAVLDQHQGLTIIPESVAPPLPTGPVEEQPAGEAPPAGGEAPPEAPAPKPGKPDPNANKPILAGQLKILRARMKSASVAEDKVVEKFGAVESWKFADFERIQAFIAGGGK